MRPAVYPRAVPDLIWDLFLAAVCILAVSPAAAQSSCDDVDDHLARIECLEAAYAQADAALNAAWPKVIKDPSSGTNQDEQRARIRAAQRAWIAFRDADCAARSDVGIPKYWRTNELTCLIEHTRTRTDYLLYHYGL